LPHSGKSGIHTPPLGIIDFRTSSWLGLSRPFLTIEVASQTLTIPYWFHKILY
jgi:hypothetical protein